MQAIDIVTDHSATIRASKENLNERTSTWEGREVHVIDSINQTDKEMTLKDSRKRTIVKSLTYRVQCLVITFTLGYALFGPSEKVVALVVVDQVAKTALHYVYERVWQKVNWGREEVEVKRKENPKQETAPAQIEEREHDNDEFVDVEFGDVRTP